MSHILVTVGTTKFDNLIRAVDTEEFHEAALKLGYTYMYIQYGRGDYIPSLGISSSIEGLKSRRLLEVEAIDYTKGFDFKKFGLVISHAGAGTVLDTLRSKVKLIVVSNQLLMNNHQMELSNKLQELNYLIAIHNPKDLVSAMQNISSSPMKVFPEADISLFKQVISEIVGFNVWNR
ncbi:glycosyl transferase [Cryptosporidium muris RN66]|uniref:UDP-N-acetylglucosamine transferase subunit ALG13 n=1 Tax=Cryptosporidium muris (strain RN66) TaxID=441375 RepID=B6AHD7_CRYMR|nr:glycosyl transferase [Cryptosporidium muris RN66]EEA07632.1 glycosyltransferase family 28 C-terminal domain-containing protein [Cryptosporidium muris RN66]|eukprot:XP_002141981.1 glycosyl transferase [Cryptosporidium muris RN66]